MKAKTETLDELSKVWNLPSIYIPKSVSDARKAWFNKSKYDVLNQTTQDDGALSEIQEIYFQKAETISEGINHLLEKSPTMDGMRIYFGSRGLKKNEVGTEDQDNFGRINFIFVSTVNQRDSGNYYKKKGNKLESISKDKAQEWVRNYQKTGGKRELLHDTLASNDLKDNCFETKHLWFEKNKVIELRDGIIKQLIRDKKAGLKMKIVSYTDEKLIAGVFGWKVPQNYQQRLTIDFVFTDKYGNDVYLSEAMLIKIKIITIYNFALPFIGDDLEWKALFIPPFDKTKLNTILELLNNKERYMNVKAILNDYYTMDTGIPAPPPSDTLESLDINS